MTARVCGQCSTPTKVAKHSSPKKVFSGEVSTPMRTSIGGGGYGLCPHGGTVDPFRALWSLRVHPSSGGLPSDLYLGYFAPMLSNVSEDSISNTTVTLWVP